MFFFSTELRAPEYLISENLKKKKFCYLWLNKGGSIWTRKKAQIEMVKPENVPRA